VRGKNPARQRTGNVVLAAAARNARSFLSTAGSRVVLGSRVNDRRGDGFGRRIEMDPIAALAWRSFFMTTKNRRIDRSGRQ